MKTETPKRVCDDGAQPRSHVTAPVVRRECIVAEISGSEASIHDFTDVDHSGQLLSRSQNPKTGLRREFAALEALFEGFHRFGRRYPAAMQTAASQGGRQEFIATFSRRLLQNKWHPYSFRNMEFRPLLSFGGTPRSK